MNVKRIFGTLLTALGIGGLLYNAVSFANTPTGMTNVKALVIYSILSLIFFLAGISLISATKDEA